MQSSAVGDPEWTFGSSEVNAVANQRLPTNE